MPDQQPSEGLSAEVDMIACELRRWSLKSAPDGFRLFRDETRMEGPWSFAEADLAEQRMSEAQAAAVQIIVDADLRAVLSALAEARSEVERVRAESLMNYDDASQLGARLDAALTERDTLAAQLVGAREALEKIRRILRNGDLHSDTRLADTLDALASMSILRGDKGCSLGAIEAPACGSPADSQTSGGGE